MWYRIFISYSSPDQEFAERIGEKLEEIGVDAYLFEHDVRPGESISEKVKSEIRKSDALLALLTENSINSQFVQQEIGFAEENTSAVLPLVETSVEDEFTGALLGDAEYIHIDFEDHEEAISELVDYLEEQKRKKRNNHLVVGGLIILLLKALAGD